MGVPFEALIPYAIMLGMFGVSGGAVSGLRYWQFEKNRGRHGLDTWDTNMMERDRRLTGSIYGQRDDSIAPKIFALNSAWRLEKRMF
ncbi:hypothetical protein FN846DRAFT_485112 [Sphaerosporella brunnea]|uniref:NADH dehydrogenase [ubiquinone] 1 alpha subcomplex subunit 1 n=1 Tax=Sphaerosporella brunnea TaxID=1250544 RepID=A0A5J5F3Q1_9PEZI|nr:hypothetical protein FN846DRAFT_485112 [Sphaerosporella brunnea]